MISSDLIRGHLDTIILKLIMEKDRYGYEISKEVSKRTNNQFGIKEATLYAVFQRLERKALVKSYQGELTHGRKRKYYTITDLGQTHFHLKVKEWKTTQEIINTLLKGEK